MKKIKYFIFPLIIGIPYTLFYFLVFLSALGGGPLGEGSSSPEKKYWFETILNFNPAVYIDKLLDFKNNLPNSGIFILLFFVLSPLLIGAAIGFCLQVIYLVIKKYLKS